MKTKGSFALGLLAAGLLQTSLVSSSNMPEYGEADRGGFEGWSGWRTNNFLNYESPYHGTSGERAEFSAFESYSGGSNPHGVGGWSGWYTNNFLNYEWPYNRTSEERTEFSAFERMPMGSSSSTSSSGMYASGTGMGSAGSDFWRQDSDSNIFLRYED
ncbi:hypothetical protein CCR95_18085 [Thiocystis minor]|uniref:hypothetical protein n=1 Tax=Thiocystis minor TaxID=61597 RepID=UPI00191182A2|nr:hypothetical protein [Thiocystis minor]MBK5965932.1 hypothetical protein [Thiocystis minor]